jgi:hypothetical protein
MAAINGLSQVYQASNQPDSLVSLFEEASRQFEKNGDRSSLPIHSRRLPEE